MEHSEAMQEIGVTRAIKLKDGVILDLEDRIEAALDLVGNIDGAHHKQWIIDQMVRVLTGGGDSYEGWVKAYEACDGECKRHHDVVGGDEDCDEGYFWDEGIAP